MRRFRFPLAAVGLATPDRFSQFERLKASSGTYNPRDLVLALGTRLGVFEIVALLGEGGMGQVYRATDTKLKRQVAIKILPPSLATDAERLARFQREAEVLAALNHPHIAAIYGLEERDGVSALVMELVEGEDLSQRIARGPIPLHEALPIATQIAEALEAAHEQGIIHRDLKPANIKVRADGTVKVLDFGLAKALAPAPASDAAAAGPGAATITSPAMTEAGMILGTAAYMSPEQARGAAVDKRSDVWAFGCVFFEMITGTRAFAGHNVSEVLASVLAREPDWTRIQSALSPLLAVYLKRCLQKDPKQRIHDIADVRLALDGAFDLPTPDRTPVPEQSKSRATWLMTTVVLAGVVAAGAAYVATRPSDSSVPRISRLEVTSSGASTLTITDNQRHIAITPDGARLVYVGNRGTQLFVRPLDSLEATAVYTRFPRGPFTSPDSQWIGFTDAGQLKKVSVSGGPVVAIATLDAPTGRGATWGLDDTIIYATTNGATGLLRVSASGGSSTAVTNPDRELGEVDHIWPEWLPNGDAVLFTVTFGAGGLDSARVAVLDLRTNTRKLLFAGSHASFVPDARSGNVNSGHLLFMTAGTLWAIRFDAARLETQGNAVAVLRNVVTTAGGEVDAVVAGDGTLAYISGAPLADPARTLAWVDLKGVEEALPAAPRAFVHPRLSPDGKRVAVYAAGQDLDVWLADLDRPTLTRVTSGPGVDSYPVWTPNGRRLVFTSQGSSIGNLYWIAADGTGVAERLTDSPNLQHASAISSDGRVLFFTETTPKTGEDVMQMSMDKPHRVSRLVHTPFAERNGILSPDGRWLAYEADDSGRFEIYVSPYPNVSSGRTLVSTSGGTRPLWARSGTELFYVDQPGGIMVVRVSPGVSWTASAPVARVAETYFTSPGNAGRTYDVSVDGQRLLMIKDEQQNANPRSFIVVQNWLEELRRAVPAQ